MANPEKKVKFTEFLHHPGFYISLLINVALVLFGLFTDKIVVLNKTKEGYLVSNSGLMIILAILLCNAFSIYFIVVKHVISCNRSQLDDSFSEQLSNLESLKKIEAHLVNYDNETIAFSHLSDIEYGIGLNRTNTHNEIWIITNDFEENKDNSSEAKELRKAILDNLAKNINYYYVVSKKYKNDIEALGEKLKQEKGTLDLTGKFHYITDDTFEFIPTPYYDIILYIKVDCNGFIEKSSEIYYCFSRIKNSEQCFYQRVEEEGIWKNLTEFLKTYKRKKSDSHDLYTLNLKN